MRCLKSCLPKGGLLETTIFLISILFIYDTYIVLISYSSVAVSSNFIIFLSIFVYGFNAFL